MFNEPCKVCPHKADCTANASCLDEVNQAFLAKRRQQFPSLMTPAQVAEFTHLLLEGWTLRRLHNSTDLGRTVVTADKLKRHMLAYLIWGAEVRERAAANAKATDVLKGHSRANETHCKKGHPYATYGIFRRYTGDKGTANQMYRTCRACQGMNAKIGRKLSEPVVETIKQLVRTGNGPSSFTSKHGKNGFVCSFVSYQRLCNEDVSVRNLVALSQQRRKLSKPTMIVMAKPAIITAPTNLRPAALTGVIAGNPDVVFTAIKEAVSPRLPRHIRDEVMGQLFLDVEEGRIALEDIARFARKYTSDIYQEEKRRISLDEPAFWDGSGTTRLDRLSETDGLWA